MRWPWSWSRTVALPPDASWILLGRWVSIFGSGVPIDSRARRLERNPGTLEPQNCEMMHHHASSWSIMYCYHYWSCCQRVLHFWGSHCSMLGFVVYELPTKNWKCTQFTEVPQCSIIVVFVRMEAKAGRKWQKAYLTLLSWRTCGDQFMSLHNLENVERCWAMLDPITQKQFPKSISPLEQTGLAAYSYMSLQIRMSWPVV